MRQPILLLLAILHTATSLAQGFEVIYGNTGDNYAIRVFEAPDQQGYLTLVNNSDDFLVTAIDTLGNIKGQIKLQVPDNTLSRKSAFYQESDGLNIICLTATNLNEITYQRWKVDFELNIILQQKKKNVVVDLSSFYHLIHLLPDHQAILMTQTGSGDGVGMYKFDIGGNIVWRKVYPTAGLNHISSPDMTNDSTGNLYVTGSGYQSSSTNVITALKFNSAGELLWAIVEPSIPVYWNSCFLINNPNEDGVLLYGRKMVHGVYLASITADGQVAWVKDFSNHFDRVKKRGILAETGNTFYLTGQIQSANGLPDATVLLRIDHTGEIAWKEQYTAFQYNYEGNLLRDHDNGFVIASRAYLTPLSTTDPCLIKTDALGHKLWSWSRVQNGDYLFFDAIVTSDQHYLLLGSVSEGSADYSAYLCQVDPLVSQVTYPTIQTFSLYPSPAIDWICISTGDQQHKFTTINIFNQFGILVQTQPITPDNNKIMLDISVLPEGLYWIGLSGYRYQSGIVKLPVIR